MPTPPLPEALREVGGRYAEGRSGFLKEPGAFFFCGWQSVWRSRGDVPFPVIWKEEAERFPPGFPLEAGDHKNLLALGENLGYAHKDMQERTLLFYLEETDGSIEFFKEGNGEPDEAVPVPGHGGRAVSHGGHGVKWHRRMAWV